MLFYRLRMPTKFSRKPPGGKRQHHSKKQKTFRLTKRKTVQRKTRKRKMAERINLTDPRKDLGTQVAVIEGTKTGPKKANMSPRRMDHKTCNLLWRYRLAIGMMLNPECPITLIRCHSSQTRELLAVVGGIRDAVRAF